MHVHKQTCVFGPGREDERRHSCFPSICRLDCGELLASFRVGSAKDTADGTIGIARSRDGGASWSEPRFPWDRREAGRAGTFALDDVPGSPHLAALTALGGGEVLATILWLDRSEPGRPMFNDETEGLIRAETLLSVSRDGGQNWGEPTRLDAAPFEGLATVCAPTLLLPDGTWAAQLEVNKPWADRSAWHHRAILKFSADRGLTWPRWAEVAHDPSLRVRYWDQRQALAPDGHLLAGLWPFDCENRREMNFHLTRSFDGGRTWSEPVDSGLDYQQPWPVFLPDGRLVVFVIDRYRSRTIRALLSEDGGRSFAPEEAVIYRHNAGEGGEDDHKLSDQQLWSFGRLEAVAVGENEIRGVYYAGDAERTAIRGFGLRAP